VRSTEPVHGRSGGVDLEEVLAADDATLIARYRHFYIPGRRARYLRRNALVALTNTSKEQAAPVLAGYAGHPDWLLRLHAIWGLGTLEAEIGRRLIEAAAERERDQRVRLEIDVALGSVAET
jgi:HEAT repeat protein